jgi:hypothetical protein
MKILNRFFENVFDPTKKNFDLDILMNSSFSVPGIFEYNMEHLNSSQKEDHFIFPMKF